MNTGRHLQRLRLRLTVIYAVVMAVALAVFALVVINADRRVRASEMDDDLLATAQLGAQAVFFEEGELVVDRFFEEDLAESYPQLWVVEAAGGPEDPVWVAAEPEDDYFQADLEDYARSVLFEDNIWAWGVWSPEPDVDLRVRGVPVRAFEASEIKASVLAIGNLNDWMDGHGRLRTIVLLASAALVLASAGAGYVIAGRGIRPAAESLQQQERLIADAAHELRTPVARIRAVAEGGIAGDEPADAALARVAGVAGDAGYLIDDLLVLARMDAGQQDIAKEPLRLDLLAEQVVDAFGDVTVDAVPAIVDGDPALLRRAIVNLVANAVHHGEPPVTVTVYPNRVVVTDTGTGIDPRVRDQLFERFRAGGASTGHGLGLPIVAWIAGAHGGSVTVEDGPEGGTVAALLLPD